MGNSTGWYDPVCYQFYFCAVGDEEAPQSLIAPAGVLQRKCRSVTRCGCRWADAFWDSRGEVIPAGWT